jgi:hypothetical protein
MYKDWLSVAVCSCLAGVIMSHVFQGLDQQAGLNSTEALNRAEQSIGEICAQQGVSAKGMTLVDATAPGQAHAAWRFDFKSSSQNGLLTVEVDDHGRARAASVKQGG